MTLHLAGFTSGEIAERLGCTDRSARRHLQHLRMRAQAAGLDGAAFEAGGARWHDNPAGQGSEPSEALRSLVRPMRPCEVAEALDHRQSSGQRRRRHPLRADDGGEGSTDGLLSVAA